VSRTSWIALLLALGLAVHGCKSRDDEDTYDEDDSYLDDDDADGQAWIDYFQPPVITVGHATHFLAVGDFCTGSGISFVAEDSNEVVSVNHYTIQEYDRIEGTIPGGLEVGNHIVCVSCSYGWGDCLWDALEVAEEDRGDDDDSA